MIKASEALELAKEKNAKRLLIELEDCDRIIIEEAKLGGISATISNLTEDAIIALKESGYTVKFAQEHNSEEIYIVSWDTVGE